MSKPISYLAMCQAGFKARTPLECTLQYGSDGYQAWMLGHWMWITGASFPSDLTPVSDCIWIVNSMEIQWLGFDHNDRKKEFIRHS